MNNEQEWKREPIRTALIWKRTEGEKPPLDKWVWGFFVSEDGSDIEDTIRCQNFRGVEYWQRGEDNDQIPVLWTNPDDIVNDLLIQNAVDRTRKMVNELLDEPDELCVDWEWNYLKSILKQLNYGAINETQLGIVKKLYDRVEEKK